MAQYAFNIVEGPSKFDLMTALFKGDVVIFKVSVHEGIVTKYEKIKCKINGISCEDGSRESWLISGYILGPKDGFLKSISMITWRNFQGYYQTRSRIGHMLEKEN